MIYRLQDEVNSPQKSSFVRKDKMKKFTNILYYILILTVVLNAGDIDRIPPTHPIYSYGFTSIGNDVWATGGTGVAKKSFSSALHNPALLSEEETVFYSELGYDFKTKWLLGFDFGEKFNVPAFATFILPYKDFNFSIGYSNTYRIFYNFKLLIRTRDNPEGTGEYFNFETSDNIYNIFASASTAFSDNFSAGLTIGLNRLSLKESFDRIEQTGEGNGILIIGGVDYNISEEFSVAASFEYLSDIEYDIENSGSSLVMESDSFGNSVKIKEIGKAVLPVTFSIGLRYAIFDQLNAYAAFKQQYWSNFDDANSTLQNIHLGIEYSMYNNMTFSTGYFSKADLNELFDQHFITFGLKAQIRENIILNMTGLTSELDDNKKWEKRYSEDSDQFHQSYLSVGVAVNL